MRLNVGLSQNPDCGVAIANIISLWNATEDVSTKLLSHLLGVGPTEATLLANTIVSSRARLSFLEAAGQEFIRDKATLGAFDDLLKQLRGRLKVRNTYAHGVFGLNENDELCILNRSVDAADSPKGIRKLSLDELSRELKMSCDVFNQAVRFHEKLHETTPPHIREALLQIQAMRFAEGIGDPTLPG